MEWSTILACPRVYMLLGAFKPCHSVWVRVEALQCDPGFSFPELNGLGPADIDCQRTVHIKHKRVPGEMLVCVKRFVCVCVCNVGLCVVGCLLFVSFQAIQASQTKVKSSLPNGHSLFIFSLSLSLLSLSHTPIIVYGVSSRYPLYLNTYTRCIKYWLNLVRMPDSRLPSKSYRMLYDFHCKNMNNWVSYVCFTLY